jgi:hypothetical protein
VSPAAAPALTPRFLSKEVAQRAVEAALKATIHSPDMKDMLSRQMCHVVVVVPSLVDGSAIDFAQMKCELRPHCLYEHSVGNPTEWPQDFAINARSKALQLWQGRNDDRTDVIPHLLFRGERALWGGVKRRGIVVACSGVQAYFDKLIAGMTADLCTALAYHAWMTSEDKSAGGVLK